ncbi:MAG: bifunctional acyl-ACP--phospholipid O-acyltransferase/long-chain-fatty-acid--ACP ligase [Pseudomonadota bacterium]
MSWLRSGLRSTLRWLIQTLFRLEVRGEWQFPGERHIIIANHESFLDGVLLAVSMPREAAFVVNSEIAAQPFFKAVLSLVDYVPIDPARPLSMKRILSKVAEGRPVVIFPEGRITLTGSLMKIYDGAAMMVLRSQAYLIPVRLDGPSETPLSRLHGLYPLRWFPKIRISILAPRQIPVPEAATVKERRRLAGTHIRNIMLDAAVKGYPSQSQTLMQAFLCTVERFGKKYELLEDIQFKPKSLGDILNGVLALQAWLEPHTKPHETVGIVLPNMTSTVAVLLALSSRARVIAMLNYTSGAEGLRSACQSAHIKTIITSRAFLDKAKLHETLHALHDIKYLYLEDIQSSLTRVDKLEIFKKRLAPEKTLIHQTLHTPAVVLFTSGSEGAPKGVVHTHATLMANVSQIRAVADFHPRDKFMGALPLFHAFGLTVSGIYPLVTGVPAFLYPNPLHYRMVPEMVYDRRCTVLFGTPTFLAGYAKFAHGYDLATLRYVVSGAEKLSEAIRTTWLERFGIRIMEGYGVTECAPVVAVNTLMAYRRHSVGQLMPGMQKVLEPVPGIDELNTGILHVKGPNIMAGYFKVTNPGVLEKPVSGFAGEGWYNTGDIVHIDSEGFVFIRGRLKRFAKIAGEMVSLDNTERLAREVSPEFMHATLARPDASKGEAIVLFTTDPTLNRAKLMTHAKQAGIHELGVPRDIRVIEKLPVLGTGKTNYVGLQAELALQLQHAAASSSQEDDA